MSENIQQESRVKKTLLNARVNLIFYFITLVLSFFSRKIFLNCLGASFIGLTGTMQNLLGFLNLAELGIGSAIGFVLYKPLFEHDRTKISEIISVMGYLYRWIGFIILGGGIILSLFLPLMFSVNETEFRLPLVYFVYYAFLTSSLIGYFINYRQNLLGADQRNYVVTAYFQTTNIVKTIIQMVLAYYTRSYNLWVTIEITFGIIYSFILNWKINQTYPWLKTEVSQGRNLLKKYPLIIRNTKRIFLHRIGVVIQWQTMPFLIYSLESLTLVAYYENYTMLGSKISDLINKAFGSSEAGVGNLIAEGNYTKAEQVLWEMLSIRFWIVGGIIVCFYLLIPPFITLWLGSKYLLPNLTLILIIWNICVQLVQSCLGQFIFGFGKFDDVWATLSQAGIFLACAIIFGQIFGLNGIIASSIFSLTLSFCIWKPYYLYHYGFNKKYSVYWSKWIKLLLLTSISVVFVLICFSNFTFIDPLKDFYRFISYACLVAGMYILISLIIQFCFNKYFVYFLYRFGKIKKILHKIPNNKLNNRY